MKRFVLAAMIAVAGIPSVAAANEHAAGSYLVVIPIRDLNLATAAGAEALRGRASNAASEACLENVRPLRSRTGTKLCRTDFMSKVERYIERASQRAQLLTVAEARR